jgi:hypothetical protein
VIAVLVPVLGRPGNAARLVWSVAGATTTPWSLLFLCSPGDDAQIEACLQASAHERVSTLVMPFPHGPGDYARKINHGVEATTAPWLFQAADDLRFHPGWDSEALATARRTRRRVIGTQDLGNRLVRRGVHSTHSLVARSYIEEHGVIDFPGKMLHEGYAHNYVDTELVSCAKARDEWAFAKRAIVEHLHPNWRKAENDRTYDLGLAEFRADGKRYMRRKRLWAGGRDRRRVHG